MSLFVISTGRCGSTMLARMLRCNRRWLVIDEFFTTFRGIVDRSAPIDRSRFVGKLVSPISPRFVTRHYLDIEKALGREAEELTYRRRPDVRYDVYDCPCVLAATLPSISEQPEAELDWLAAYGRSPSEPRPFIDHSLALFEDWRLAHGKTAWIERSGWSTPYMNLVRQRAPAARFIYLRRDSGATVRSMAMHPYFALVGELRTILMRHGIQIDDLALGAHRLRDPLVLAYVKLLQPLFGLPWRFDAYYGPAGYEMRLATAADIYRTATQRAEAFVAELPTDQVITVDYEALVTTPRPAMEELAHFIGDGDDDGWIEAAAQVPDPARMEILPRSGPDSALSASPPTS